MTTGYVQHSTHEEARAFFQRRVAMFALVSWAMSLLFLAWRSMSRHEIGTWSYNCHLAGGGLMFVAWLICRRGSWSPRMVLTIEAVAVVGSSALYCGMMVGLPFFGAPYLIVASAITMVLFARALYVPSTSRRSLVFALVIGVAYVAMVWHTYGTLPVQYVDLVRADYPEATAERQRLFVTLAAAVWWTATTALTTLASRVIYGLRAEVADIKKLGQYNLGERLGEGGMGIVYRASHAMLQRETAVKLLPVDKIGEKTLARFEREVKLTAKLTHPNTVTVFDYGRTPSGVFYYAMELLEGATLDHVVELGGPLPAARVIHILRQAADALSEAHGIGLIHRDVKPANIMLCERGGILDTVKVLDFGLVKELDQEDAKLTGAGVVTGTPQYMPPEALTKPDSVDGRSDIYALGAVGYLNAHWRGSLHRRYRRRGLRPSSTHGAATTIGDRSRHPPRSGRRGDVVPRQEARRSSSVGSGAQRSAGGMQHREMEQ